MHVSTSLSWKGILIHHVMFSRAGAGETQVVRHHTLEVWKLKKLAKAKYGPTHK